MRTRIGLAILAAGAAVSAAILGPVIPVSGQSPSTAMPRTADRKDAAGLLGKGENALAIE